VPLDFDSVPSPVLGVIEALRFNDRSTERLHRIAENEWPALLTWSDARQLTLLLHALCGEELPQSVQDRLSRNHAGGVLRLARITGEFAEIASTLNRRGVEFALLKGMSHAPALTPDPVLRAQGDIDLWFGADALPEARAVLTELGYAPGFRARTRHDSRHLPPMARPGNWTWRGNMFDPEMPIHVEAHFQLWSKDAEHISIPGQSDFWNRRILRDFDGQSASVLCLPDLLGFAALHLLLHLLHGDLPLQRAWEIAHFLHVRAGDEMFWSAWRRLHSPALRRLEAVAFAITQIWFRCNVNDCVTREVGALTEDVQLWLDHYALSPLKQHSAPNKDELWLHLALIPSAAGRARVLLRRLFPLVLARKGGLSRARVAHHSRTLTPTVLDGLHWMWRKRQGNRMVVPAPSQ